MPGQGQGQDSGQAGPGAGQPPSQVSQDNSADYFKTSSASQYFSQAAAMQSAYGGMSHGKSNKR